MTIAEGIRLYSQHKGFSQAQLAEKSQANNKSLSRYELGSSIPPAVTLKNSADFLGVSSDALLNDDTVAEKYKDLLQKFEVIEEMNEDDKIIVNRFLDLTIRDFKTKQPYAK